MSLYNKHMEALRLKPSAYWTLDDSSPFTDYSGYNRSAVRTGVEVKGLGLVSGTAFSQILDSTHTVEFDSPVYRAGKERNSFTMVATVFPVARTTVADQQILSNDTKYDGLTINGTVVSFSTKYLATGEAKCSYDFSFMQRLDLVAIHTANKNTLWVNGKVVDEVSISAEQQADIYDAPDNSLYSGNTTSTQGIMLNCVGFYTRALQTEEVARLYSGGNRRSQVSPVRMYEGHELFVSKQVRQLFLDATWTTEEDWNAGMLNNVSVEDGMLVPNRIDDLTVAGTWKRSIDLYTGGSPLPINSVNMTWVGKNVTVEASVNDTTWVTVNRGENLSNIATGFDPTNKSLAIRITFAEGEDEGYIDNFQVNGYNSNTYVPPVGRTLTFTNPVVNFEEREPLELREDWGAILTGGTLAWGADNSEAAYPARTIQVWMKKNTTAAVTLSFSPTTTYVNGVAGATSARGEWAVYHWVLPSDLTTFSITGSVTIGRAGIFDTALDASTIESIYNYYVGIQTTRENDSSTIAISEPTASVITYGYDWGLLSA